MPFADGGEIPTLVQTAAALVKSPFFTVDVALRDDGELRLVELGDGQVSDRKHWSAESFIQVLS